MGIFLSCGCREATLEKIRGCQDYHRGKTIVIDVSCKQIIGMSLISRKILQSVLKISIFQCKSFVHGCFAYRNYGEQRPENRNDFIELVNREVFSGNIFNVGNAQIRNQKFNSPINSKVKDTKRIGEKTFSFAKQIKKNIGIDENSHCRAYFSVRYSSLACFQSSVAHSSKTPTISRILAFCSARF